MFLVFLPRGFSYSTSSGRYLIFPPFLTSLPYQDRRVCALGEQAQAHGSFVYVCLRAGRGEKRMDGWTLTSTLTGRGKRVGDNTEVTPPPPNRELNYCCKTSTSFFFSLVPSCNDPRILASFAALVSNLRYTVYWAPVSPVFPLPSPFFLARDFDLSSPKNLRNRQYRVWCPSSIVYPL